MAEPEQKVVFNLTREEFRAEVEQVIRNAYNEAWAESKRWPNRKNPPAIEVIWDQPGGIAIREDFS